MRFEPLHHALGVRVHDVDLLGHVSDEEVAELRRAMDEHHLLLFRGGPQLPPDRQVEISGWFGPPVDDLAEGRLWTTFSNVTNAGKMGLPFHSDYTYTDCPVKGLSLHALAVPPGGATTSFVSGDYAWRTLSPERQAHIADLVARHDYTPSVAPDEPTPPTSVAHHPLRLLHPRSGVPLLFVHQLSVREVVGMDPDESATLLRELLDHLYDPVNVYVHQWQLHDLVVWDNLALQHARDETDVAQGERTFQRVVLNERPYAELVPGVTEAQKTWRDTPVGSR
jgi:taurine dioxygenase